MATYSEVLHIAVTRGNKSRYVENVSSQIIDEMQPEIHTTEKFDFVKCIIHSQIISFSVLHEMPLRKNSLVFNFLHYHHKQTKKKKKTTKKQNKKKKKTAPAKDSAKQLQCTS